MTWCAKKNFIECCPTNEPCIGRHLLSNSLRIKFEPKQEMYDTSHSNKSCSETMYFKPNSTFEESIINNTNTSLFDAAISSVK